MDYPTSNQPSDADFASWSQPIGSSVPRHAAPLAKATTLPGQYVTLEPVTQSHIADWWDAFGRAPDHDRLHTYMLDGPWVDRAGFEEYQARFVKAPETAFFALVPKTDGEFDGAPASTTTSQGRFALIRADRTNRSIEVGHVIFSPTALQGSPASTEAFYLLGRYIFEDLGYRRWEWKCNALNAPSKRAAERLGFVFEGTFRKHYIVKGRSRDTAWFSIVDDEWPRVKAGFEAWLDAANFDENGRQRRGLKEIREQVP
ncbi:unnamed protein product [Jaminaea pallidilutea]